MQEANSIIAEVPSLLLWVPPNSPPKDAKMARALAEELKKQGLLQVKIHSEALSSDILHQTTLLLLWCSPLDRECLETKIRFCREQAPQTELLLLFPNCPTEKSSHWWKYPILDLLIVTAPWEWTAQSIKQRFLEVQQNRLLQQKLMEAEELQHLYASSNARLLQQRDELEGFAQHVAHSLKNPLSGLFTLLESWRGVALSDTEQQQEWTESVDEMKQAIRWMTSQISDLLTLAGLRHRKIPIEPLEMEGIAKQAWEHLRHLKTFEKTTISFPETWPSARGYAPWVEEVWRNLFSNALYYTGPTPVLMTGAEVTGTGFVRFWLKDHGPGIHPEHRSQLFKPFVRFDVERQEGHGLGLAIVHDIIQRLGGEVGVESIEGKGSTFFFTLPEV